MIFGLTNSYNCFGWLTAGTEAPSWNEGGDIPPADRDPEWDGSYFSNDFQSVTDADAKAMASALHRAVNSVVAEQTLTSSQPRSRTGAFKQSLNLPTTHGEVGLTLAERRGVEAGCATGFLSNDDPI